MFLLPFSLFAIATYLRPRTRGELSYLLTGIEGMSGLWCLLFAPLLIQLILIGQFLARNAEKIAQLFARSAPPSKPSQDLSDPRIPTIDIAGQQIRLAMDAPLAAYALKEAIAVQPTAVKARETQPSSPIAAPPKVEPAIATPAAVQPAPQKTKTTLKQTSQPAASNVATRLVEMRYRGATYLKSVPVKASTTSYVERQPRGLKANLAFRTRMALRAQLV